MQSSALLLSIQPRFAEKIFDGSKTFELRKVRPKVSSNDAIIVYVSSPEMMLKAILTVDNVINEEPNQLWDIVMNDAGVTREEFDDYFLGIDKGYAIKIKDVNILSSPVALSDLRELIPGFTPPQIYRYFSGEELKKLMERIQ
jgi:predicted transcriptional regulator